MAMHCAFCGRGKLRGVTVTERLAYRGRTFDAAGYAYSVCEACNEEVVTLEQMKHNERLVEALA